MEQTVLDRRLGRRMVSCVPMTHYGAHKVGSKECEEGQIFIEPQGFCVTGRASAVKDGYCRKGHGLGQGTRLDTKYGVVPHQPCLMPPITSDLGEITSYPPGYKENAGIFCHNNPSISDRRDGQSAAETAHGEVYTRDLPGLH